MEWFQAIGRGDFDFVAKNVGAFACSINEQGETGLMIAVRCRNTKLVQLLLDHESRCISRDGSTALAIAIFTNNRDAVQILLSQESDILMPSGQTPLDLAKAQGNADILALFDSNNGGNCTASALTTGTIDGVRDSYVVRDGKTLTAQDGLQSSLSTDTFKTIELRASSTHSVSADIELCKAAIWQLADRATQSQQKCEEHMMELQCKLTSALLRYKQELKIARTIFKLMGISDDSLQEYREQAKKLLDENARDIPSPISMLSSPEPQIEATITPRAQSAVIERLVCSAKRMPGQVGVQEHENYMVSMQCVGSHQESTAARPGMLARDQYAEQLHTNNQHESSHCVLATVAQHYGDFPQLAPQGKDTRVAAASALTHTAMRITADADVIMDIVAEPVPIPQYPTAAGERSPQKNALQHNSNVYKDPNGIYSELDELEEQIMLLHTDIDALNTVLVTCEGNSCCSDQYTGNSLPDRVN